MTSAGRLASLRRAPLVLPAAGHSGTARLGRSVDTADAGALRIAYFINRYPKVSHSFIRREIQALEAGGAQVLRIALRGWDEVPVDADDAAEQAKTRYVLAAGVGGLLLALLRVSLSSPWRFARGFALALRLGRRPGGGPRGGSGGVTRCGPARPLACLAEACRILPWLSAFGARHVHAHFGTNSTDVVMLARVLGGPPFSFTAHGPEEFDRPQSLGLDEKIRRAAFVAAVSSFGRSQLCRWVAHEYWDRIEVVHCGLEGSYFALPPTPVPARPRLVCVGRLCEQKGQLLLVDAVARLATRGVECELVLAGDGEMRGAIETLIARHALAGRVCITGWIDGARVREEIVAARALVLPSFAEGLPVVLMEAMALRRPVLSTYVAGIPELVCPGVDGWLVPAGSLDALVDALAEVLGRSPAALQAMGEAAYRRVLERHSIETSARRLLSLFATAGQCSSPPCQKAPSHAR